MTTILDRPQRANVAHAEWRISVELVREGVVLERSDPPLAIADSWFNDRKTPGRLEHAGKNIATWIDDFALKRARTEAAAKKASKGRRR